MPHIHTQPGQHDLTTTAFIIRTDGKEPLGLVHVHKKLGMLLPVGGHVELDETPWSAVLHEIKEEAGYDQSQLSVLQPSDRIRSMNGVKIHPVPLFLQTHKFKQDLNHYHIDIGFLFVCLEPPANLPAVGESTSLMWLTNKQIQSRKNEMPADIAQIYDFIFEVAIKKWEQLPTGGFDK